MLVIIRKAVALGGDEAHSVNTVKSSTALS